MVPLAKEVSPECLWWEICSGKDLQKEVLRLEWKSEGVVDGDEEKDGLRIWDKHTEVKLVHEAGSWFPVHTEKSDQCFSRRGGGWTSKRDKIRGMKYDYQFEEMTLRRQVDWLVVMRVLWN